MNPKTLMIIALLLFVAGLASTGLGIFWHLLVSETNERWEQHHTAVSELLKKSGEARASGAPDAHQLLEELEKENRYVKSAEENRAKEAGDRNLYLGIGLPMIVISFFLLLRARKNTRT